MLLRKRIGSKEFFFFKGKDNTSQTWVGAAWELAWLYFSAVLLCEDITVLISLSYQK